MNRRTFVETLGTAGMATLAGCGWRNDRVRTGTTEPHTTVEEPTTDTSTTSPEPGYEERFETVVDATEAGADPSGTEPIDEVFEAHADDGTVLEFPPGKYLVENPLRVDGLSNFGVVGEDATLVPADGSLKYWFIGLDLSDFLLAGFVLDHRGENTGPQIQVHATGGRSVVRDLSISGFHDRDQIAFTFAVENEAAELSVERLFLPDGSSDAPAIYLTPESVGSATFADLHLEHWAQGIYGSAHSGPIEVRGGKYLNNNVASIRLGGRSGQTAIRDVTIRIDDPIPDRWVDEPKNVRGIWLREGDATLIENCDVTFADLQGLNSEAAILINTIMGRATIRDTSVRLDDGTYAIRAKSPSDEASELQGKRSLPSRWRLRCERVSVTGDTATDGEAIRVYDRSSSVLRDVEIRQRGANCRGIVFRGDVRNCLVDGPSVVTSSYPLVVERAGHDPNACSVTLRNVQRLVSTGIDRSASLLVHQRAGSFCIDGEVLGTDRTDDETLAIVATEVRDGGLYGRTVPVNGY